MQAIKIETETKKLQQKKNNEKKNNKKKQQFIATVGLQTN